MKYNVDNKMIGNNIRIMREFYNMSREELSEKVSISSSFLKNIEYGLKGCSISTLANLSKELNVTIDYLVFDNVSDDNDNKKLMLLMNNINKDDMK